MDGYTPICYDCRSRMRDTYQTVMVAYPEKEPHTLWAADVFECPACHKRTVAGFAMNPFVRNAAPNELADYLKDGPNPVFLLKG